MEYATPPDKGTNKYKIVTIGSHAVGKTSLINRFVNGSYNAFERPTVSGDFIVKSVSTSKGEVNLWIWDTAGQERYKALIPQYIRDAYAYLMVYDVTSMDSFEVVQNDLEIIRKDGTIDSPIFLVANKIDLEPGFDLDLVEEFAQKESLVYWETSALTGEHVKDLFEEVAEQIATKFQEENAGVDISGTEERTKKCC